MKRCRAWPFVFLISALLIGLAVIIAGPPTAQATATDLVVFAWIDSADAPSAGLVASTGQTTEIRVFETDSMYGLNSQNTTSTSVPGAPRATSIVLMRDAGYYRMITDAYVYMDEATVDARPGFPGSMRAVLRA